MATTLDQFRPSLVYRWDVGGLGWVVWDGSLETGALTIGTVDQGRAGSDPWLTTSGLAIPAHDYISLGYTGSDLTTVTYKTGGASGTTVATLTLAYAASVLQSVTKS